MKRSFLLLCAVLLVLGCALPWLWVDDIPRESWYIPLCACVDGDEIRYFSGGKNPTKS